MTKRRTKVERIVDEYGLDGLGEELERRWLGASVERSSLRTLADDVNRRLLEATMVATGRTPLEGEVANLYDLLTGDDVSSGVRTQAETRLQRDGVDVEKVRGDFVSHQAVYTYLTKHRGVRREAEQTDEDRVAKGGDAIQRLVSRLVAVTENILGNLRNTDRIALGEATVFVEVRVYCEGCGRQYDVSQLLSRGGCQCGR